MDFEKYYNKLPDFIKYNNYLLNFFLKIPKILRNTNSQQLNSQNQLLNLLLTSCDIKITGTLRNVQQLYLELLRFIHNVCTKHNIDYWLDYGTLLGAVRHEGFIPWDDDIDLSMMRDDYNKLIKVFPEEINKFSELKENCGLTLLLENERNYFKDFKSVYDIDNNDLLNEDRFSYLQIAILKPYIKIDFFPKDYIKDDELNNFSKNYVSTKYKFNKDVLNGKVEFYKEFYEQRRKIGITENKTNYYSNSLDCVQLSPVLIYKSDETFPLKTIKFEGYDFKCPKNSDAHLKIRFGDSYMNIPKIIEHHNIIPFIQSQFNSKEEMDNSFNYSLNMLRKINEQYEKEKL